MNGPALAASALQPPREASVGGDAALLRELRALDPARARMTEIVRLDRRLDRAPAGEPVRIAICSNFTLSFLPPCIRTFGARDGWRPEVYVAPSGQHMQEVLDPASGLAGFAPDLVLLALSLRGLEPEQTARLASLAPAARRRLHARILEQIDAWCEAALKRTAAALFVSNFTTPGRAAGGLADLRDEYGEMEFYAELNLALLRRLKAESRLFLFDADRLQARAGRDRSFDPRLFYLARIEWAEPLLPYVGEELIRCARAAKGRAKKCLALDLDNTLWGGVLGEDGPDGVKCGAGDPAGEAFYDFQCRLKALRDRGVLLAACSKNNPGDVAEVFARRADMPLARADFAAWEIGWGAKHLALARIAETLNIGLDSIVFADDHPAEIALVNEMLPMVETMAIPADPAELSSALDRVTSFERLSVLPEDGNRAQYYVEEARRREGRERAGSLENWRRSLQTTVRIRRASESDLPRVHQLFAKTNQFNLTTRRYSLAELAALREAPDCGLWLAAARDRFGDLGTIAVWLLRSREAVLELDSFLMSCRAMGRGLESALMNHVKREFVERSAASVLEATFLPTAKNRPAEAFLKEEGFVGVGRAEPHGTTYRLLRREARQTRADWIEVEE